jgi:hypothetical protein
MHKFQIVETKEFIKFDSGRTDTLQILRQFKTYKAKKGGNKNEKNTIFGNHLSISFESKFQRR